MNKEDIFFGYSQEVILEYAQFSLQYLLDTTYLIYILIGIVSLIIGIQIGKQNILISKQQKEKLEQFKNMKLAKEKSKINLQKEQKKLSLFSKLFYVFIGMVITIDGYLYYYEIILVSYEIPLAISIFLIIITEGYKYYENYKLKSIKHNLEQTEKETNKIILEIQNSLGEEILRLIKNEFNLSQKEKINDQISKAQIVLQSQFEEKYKGQIEELKKKIKTLEDKEFQQKQELHNFKRNTQSHKTEPILKQKENQNDVGIEILKKQILHLSKEGQIQKDMISKVINFEWCPDCVGMKVHCIEAYFEKAKLIGDEYQQKLLELEDQNKVQS